MAKKAVKKRANKYEQKVAIVGTFADVLKVSVTPGKQEEPVKKAAKKKK
ncbi:MAG TPA: hypothetical protein VL943_14855 [Niabella sp.]|nr:hypothetical protein [Niabella sp.]